MGLPQIGLSELDVSVNVALKLSFLAEFRVQKSAPLNR